KRGLCLVIGFQNISQIRAIYGRDTAVSLTSSPTTKVFLRIDDAESARWASDILGSREVERMTVQQLAGLSNYREGVTLGAQRTAEHIVSPAEIALLRPLETYIAVAGHDRCKTKVLPFYMQRNQPGFIPKGIKTEHAPLYDAC